MNFPCVEILHSEWIKWNFRLLHKWNKSGVVKIKPSNFSGFIWVCFCCRKPDISATWQARTHTHTRTPEVIRYKIQFTFLLIFQCFLALAICCEATLATEHMLQSHSSAIIPWVQHHTKYHISNLKHLPFYLTLSITILISITKHHYPNTVSFYYSGLMYHMLLSLLGRISYLSCYPKYEIKQHKKRKKLRLLHLRL